MAQSAAPLTIVSGTNDDTELCIFMFAHSIESNVDSKFHVDACQFRRHRYVAPGTHSFDLIFALTRFGPLLPCAWMCVWLCALCVPEAHKKAAHSDIGLREPATF